jgi:hypothetical protein
MKLTDQETIPPTFKAEVSPDDRKVIRAAFTDRIVRQLAADEANEETVEGVNDRDIEFSLLEDGIITLTEDDLHHVRDTLIGFGQQTSTVALKQAQVRYEHFYYNAKHITERIKLGRSARKIARLLASQRPDLDSSESQIENEPLPLLETERQEQRQLPPGPNA